VKYGMTDKELNERRYAETKVPVRGDEMAKAATSLQADLRKAKKALKVAREIIDMSDIACGPEMRKFDRLCKELGL